MNVMFAILNAIATVADALWHLLPHAVTETVFLLGLAVVGMMASCVNMLSGGGSMLVLGLMILAGIDPITANATNRAGVFVSTATGAAAYKNEKYTDIKESLKLGVWSIPGAVTGAFVSVSISGQIYEKILAVVMILIIASMFLKKSAATPAISSRSKWTYPAMLLVGFYGGLVQVGVGILIFGVLRYASRMELMRINMHRVFIVLIFILPAMVVFIWSGKINWMYAAALSVGSAVGSWVTVKWTLKRGEKIIRIGLAVSVALMSLKFLFF